MDVLKALAAVPGGKTEESGTSAKVNKDSPAPAAGKDIYAHNFMADVLERHEKISNRLKNKNAPRR